MSTLLVDRTISDVSTLQFIGGSDANDIVDISADISAGNINIRNAARVIVDSKLITSSNIYINADEDIILRSGSLLRVTEASSRITGIAGKTVILEDGARVERVFGLGDENKVVISKLPPDITVSSPALSNGVSNIDRLGKANVQVDAGANHDRNFVVFGKDLGNGDELFSTSNLAGPTNPGAFEFSLQFDFITGVTTLRDQDMVVTFQSDKNNQIVFVANGEILTSRDVKIKLRGPLDGLISAITIESPEVPELVSVTQIDEIPFETTVENLNDVSEAQFIVSNNSQAEIEQERKYVLRLVVTDESGEEKEIDIGDLSSDALDQEKLPQLFESLPDDRYRIYLILEDGSEQSVLDVNIRDKQAVEVESEDETLQFKKIDIDMEPSQSMISPYDSAKSSFLNSVPLEQRMEQAPLESESKDEFLLIGKIQVDLRAG